MTTNDSKPHPSSEEWKRAKWLGTGAICSLTGYQSLMFELADGSRIRLLLKPGCTRAVRESLDESYENGPGLATLPHWLMSSEILQSAGLNVSGQSTEPPVISSIATMGDT